MRMRMSKMRSQKPDPPDRHARPCAGHPRLSFRKPDVDGRDKPGHAVASNQILLANGRSQLVVLRDELADELVQPALEDLVHAAVLDARADRAGLALRNPLPAIGARDVIEIEHEILIA